MIASRGDEVHYSYIKGTGCVKEIRRNSREGLRPSRDAFCPHLREQLGPVTVFVLDAMRAFIFEEFKAKLFKEYYMYV